MNNYKLTQLLTSLQIPNAIIRDDKIEIPGINPLILIHTCDSIKNFDKQKELEKLSELVRTRLFKRELYVENNVRNVVIITINFNAYTTLSNSRYPNIFDNRGIIINQLEWKWRTDFIKEIIMKAKEIKTDSYHIKLFYRNFAVNNIHYKKIDLI